MGVERKVSLLTGVVLRMTRYVREIDLYEDLEVMCSFILRDA